MRTKINMPLFALISIIAFTGLASLCFNSSAAAGPRYLEVEVTTLSGDIYVNPDYIGKEKSVRTIDRNGILGEKIRIEGRILTDGWKKYVLPPEAANAYGIIVSGENGILKISLPSASPNVSASGLEPIADLVLPFGSMNTTLVFPVQSVLEPSKYGIEILNNETGSFVKGDIIVLKSDQAAINFNNLGPSVVNDEGLMRVSLTKPGGAFINSDLPAWGYNVFVPETGVDNSGLSDTVPVDETVPIMAEVFGLPKDSRIKFRFDPLPDQIINPSLVTLTVEEINSGKPISTVKTKFAGSQPLSVTVTKVN